MEEEKARNFMDSDFQFLCSNLGMYSSSKAANKHQFHRCLSVKFSVSPYIPIPSFLEKDQFLQHIHFDEAAEFILVHLNFCQTGSALTNPGGISENSQGSLILSPH